jgi:hypothetical protein
MAMNAAIYQPFDALTKYREEEERLLKRDVLALRRVRDFGWTMEQAARATRPRIKVRQLYERLAGLKEKGLEIVEDLDP